MWSEMFVYFFPWLILVKWLTVESRICVGNNDVVWQDPDTKDRGSLPNFRYVFLVDSNLPRMMSFWFVQYNSRFQAF